MKKIKITASVTVILLLFFNHLSANAKAGFEFEKKPLSISSPIIPLIEGYFYRDDTTTAIYWLLNNRFHHIQDIRTYNNIFKNANYYLFHVTDINLINKFPSPVIIGDKMGFPFTSDAKILDAGAGALLRTGNDSSAHLLIPNPETFSKYHLNWAALETCSYNPAFIIPFLNAN